MTEPNWEAMDRWLAEKVMGMKWHRYLILASPGGLRVSDWRPHENKAQAIEVVEALLTMTMETDGEKWHWVIDMGGESAGNPGSTTRTAPIYWCRIEDNPSQVHEGVFMNSYLSGNQPSLAKAIVLAACEATRYKEA